ncbi:MAG: ABC transporter ATP-binding protein [Thermomicrobiales bacterium]|nr:ABC transporter ATP-binding protein [Thermomicrobiales bacterium]
MVSIASPSNSEWHELIRLLSGIGRRNPWPLLALTLLTIVANTRTGLYVLTLGSITQALIDQNRNQAIAWAAVSLGAGLLEQLYWPFRNHLRSIVEDDAGVYLQKRVLRNTAKVPLEHYEYGPFFTTLTRANDNLGERAAAIISSGFDLLQVLVMFVSILAPVWFIDARIVWIILLGCIPVFSTTWRTARAFHDVKTRNAINELYATKLSDLVLQRDAAAEIRLFGTGPELVRRWLGARNRIAQDSVQAVGKISRAQLTGEIFTAASMASAIALLVHNMINGAAPLGSLIAVAFAIVWGVGMVGGSASVIRGVRENSVFLSDIFTFEREASRFKREPIHQISPSTAAMTINLCDASFRYPETDRDVVHNLNLEIAPGEHIALLGENGAGKSTLVRLIAGLYAPTSGKVYQDNCLATDARTDIAAVFQDFVRWQLPLRDNVEFGCITAITDEEAILVALSKSDLRDLPDQLAEGLDTWLGREFGERDLSGGQWQRLAIARAFFRDARLLILDEPTAALDPLAEQRLFERFRELADGKTAITISHRIGPARSADRILVMDQGQIVEDGTHDTLMAQDGLYAAMFRSQQEWYNHSSMERE